MPVSDKELFAFKYVASKHAAIQVATATFDKIASYETTDDIIMSIY